MERKFELVTKYQGVLTEEHLPVRGTEGSAGYDFKCAEDTVIPSLFRLVFNLGQSEEFFNKVSNIMGDAEGMSLADTESLLKEFGCRPTLVPTGVRAIMPEGEYLGLKARSSTPLKYLLVVANSEGVIDSDYQFADNEGHIFVQLINLSPFDIVIKKGEKIAQGIFIPHNYTTNDKADKKRTGGFGSTGK